MITYRITIVVGGREQAITIQADRYSTESEQCVFYLNDAPVAWVPVEIAIEIAEA